VPVDGVPVNRWDMAIANLLWFIQTIKKGIQHKERNEKHRNKRSSVVLTTKSIICQTKNDNN